MIEIIPSTKELPNDANTALARTPEDEEIDTVVDNNQYIIEDATDDNSEADKKLVESDDSKTVEAWGVFRSLTRERMLTFGLALLFIGLLDKILF